MRTTFQRVGKSSFEMHVFKICVKGDVKWSETSLMNLVWMLSGPVVSRAVGPQRFALPNNFMIGNTLQTKGSIRVLRKRINTPMQLLLINCHWGIDTLSCKSKVLIQFIGIDSYWLMARVTYAMDRLPYFLVPLRRKCIGHKTSLCFPNQFLKTVTGVLEDILHSLTLRGCVCFPMITLACLLQRSNVRIIQPDRRLSVTLTRFKGVCHSKQSEIRVLNAITCSLGSSN